MKLQNEPRCELWTESLRVTGHYLWQTHYLMLLTGCLCVSRCQLVMSKCNVLICYYKYYNKLKIYEQNWFRKDSNLTLEILDFGAAGASWITNDLVFCWVNTRCLWQKDIHMYSLINFFLIDFLFFCWCNFFFFNFTIMHIFLQK